MNVFRAFLIAALSIAAAVPVFSQVTFDPHGFGILAEVNPREVTLTLSNEGNRDVTFSVETRLDRDQMMRQEGPQRDNPGDVLGRFSPPGGAAQHYNVGLAWDEENQWMWNNDFHNGTCSALDPADEFRAARQFNVQARCMSIGLLNDHLYMVVDPEVYLTHYNRAGNRLDNVGFNYTTVAVTTSPEMERVFVMGLDNNIHVYEMADNGMVAQQVGVINNWQGFIANTPCRSMTWIDGHPDGQLWFHSTRGPNNEAGNWAWQVHVDTEDWAVTERVQVFRTRDGNGAQHWDGIGHDGENLWITYWQEAQGVIMDDGVSEVRLLEFPREGEIAAGEQIELIGTVTKGRAEAGYYEFKVYLTFDDGEAESIDSLSVYVTVDEMVFDVIGEVTDAVSGEPIEGAYVCFSDDNTYRVTGGDGVYHFEELPDHHFWLGAWHPDYLPGFHPNVGLEEGLNFIDFALEYATCDVSVDRFDLEIAIDEQEERTFTISNEGTGTLQYQIDRRLVGDADAEPWELRRSLPVSQILEDERIEGVAFAHDRFYFAGANDADSNMVYVVDLDGQLVDQFVQAGTSRYGYKDLEFDGEWLWGTGEQAVYATDLEGRVQHQFNGPNNPSNNIAYDPENEVLWICGTTTDISAYDREGNAAGNQISRKGLRLYGLSWYPQDPDGYCLYATTLSGAGEFLIYKFNTGNGDTIRVATLNGGEASAYSGGWITNTYDVYSWVFMTVYNIPPADGGDQAAIYQLDARKDWFAVDPSTGEIPGGDEPLFTVTFDAAGLPAVEFEGEFVITHNGRGGDVVIPVTMNVLEGGIAQRQIQLVNGWNMISTNVIPENGGMPTIFAGLVEQGILSIVKDDNGRFYFPALGYNGMQPWDVAKGYQVRVTQPGALNITGEAVPPDRPIPLRRGWQMISYFPRQPVDVRVVLAGILEHVILVKDGFGRFCIPSRFSNMLPLSEGFGYQVNVDADCELVYQLGDQFIAGDEAIELPPTHFPVVHSTGKNMSVLMNAEFGMQNAECGEIGVFTEGGICVGSASFQIPKSKIQNYIGLAVWGDDLTTAEVDGVIDEGKLTYKLWDGKTERLLSIRWIEGEERYSTDGIAIGEIEGLAVTPTSFTLYSPFPNPFNGLVTIEYLLPEPADVKLTVFDLTGRTVATLVQETLPAGTHRQEWNSAGTISGMFIVRLEANGQTVTQKIAIVK